MTNEGRVRRTWGVSPNTTDVLSRLQLISGLEKSELVDIAINLLSQTTLTVRQMTGRPSKDIINAIAEMFPNDERYAAMELDSALHRFDLSELLSMLTGDDPMKIHDISDSTDRIAADENGGDS